MGRATTKADLITAAGGQFDKMWNLIDGMDEELQEGSFAQEMATKGKEAHWRRDKNLRDVLIHLYEWHQLLLKWVKSNLDGERRPFLPEPYNWRTYLDMNMVFWERHQGTSLSEAKRMLKKSHREVIALIETFTNDELYAKGVFDWTGSSTLGSYCVSATASHYDWAIKKIKAHIKTSMK